MQSKVVIVTGASRGIGANIVKTLAKKGYNVILNYNTSEKEAITEVKRRKEIVKKYRFKIDWQGSKEDTMKALDKVIDFAEEHE